MKIGRAVVAGLAGAMAMTILAWIVRLTGIEFNSEMMLGTMTNRPPDGVTWTIGLMMHLILSVVIALIYAWGFEHWTHRAGAKVGTGFALIHIVFAAMAMMMIPMIHPMIPEKMPAPGAFMMNMGGIFVALFFIEHLLYGSIVGATYGAVVHPRESDVVVGRGT